MTTEEIKSRVSILDVASMYGLRPNREGFCHCCFPGHRGTDRGASLKLYPTQNSFNCYGCGANGDIFTFVELMEGCSFKDAFKKLGGSYDGKISTAAVAQIAKRKREAATRDKKMERMNREYVRTCEEIQQCNKRINYAPRDSEIYATALKRIDWLNYKADYLFDLLGKGLK